MFGHFWINQLLTFLDSLSLNLLINLSFNPFQRQSQIFGDAEQTHHIPSTVFHLCLHNQNIQLENQNAAEFIQFVLI